jgi:hypothetical protein
MAMVGANTEEVLRRRHLIAALLCAAPFLIGLCLRVSPESATLWGLHAPVCLIRWLLPNIGCPGCGLVRSVALACHGKLMDSVTVNPAGMLVLVLSGCGFIMRSYIFLCGRMTARQFALLRAGRMMLAAGVLAAWISRAASI